MSCNAYMPHVLVIPEDDANRQLANGFVGAPGIAPRRIQVLPPAGGWRGVVETLLSDHVSGMRRFEQRLVVLLLDFDEQVDARRGFVEENVPGDLASRVFTVGVLSEPERLRQDLDLALEEIGAVLAGECRGGARAPTWRRPLLEHNEPVLAALADRVSSFLFEA